MNMKKRTVALLAALVLLVGCAIGGVIAWLTDETDSVKNTFTVGNVDITLVETDSKQDNDNSDLTNSYKMVPGNKIAKDPVVTVEDGSEDCWLFVKVEKSTTLDSYITYAVAGGWTALDETNYPGVYYRTVLATDADKSFSVLENDQVKVKEDVTKGMMDALNAEDAVQPTLTFTAYAVQKDNIADAKTAWAKL